MTAGEQSHGPLQLTASCPVGFAPHLDVHGDDPAEHRCPCGARAWAEGAAPQPARRTLPSPQGTGNSQARLKNTSSETNVRGKLSEKSALPLVRFYCHITGKKVSAVPPNPPSSPHHQLLHNSLKNTDRTNQNILWKPPFALPSPWSKPGEVMKYIPRHLLLAVHKTT